MKNVITAIFDERLETEKFLTELDQAGLKKENVFVLITEKTRDKDYMLVEKDEEAKAKAKDEDDSVEVGATIGGLTGAIYMSLASAGVLLVPGLNLIVSGTLVGTLAGLGLGSVAGGFIGWLVKLGVSEDEAKLYEAAIRKGSILVAIDTKDEAETKKVQEILKKSSAQQVQALAA